MSHVIVRLDGAVKPELSEPAADRVICDVAAVPEPDAATVDCLAQLQLKVRRHGRSIEMHHVSPQLLALFVLMGLDEVVRLVPD